MKMYKPKKERVKNSNPHTIYNLQYLKDRTFELEVDGMKRDNRLDHYLVTLRPQKPSNWWDE
jgi:hypothetical protein|tara:strand:+ start:315 stop:500 length:186 start_codon:yes stop_codon:yes gene_type:complete